MNADSALHIVLARRLGFMTIAGCLWLAGCASPYPMGLTGEQWNALPPERQAEYRAQQHAIDQEQRRQMLELQREREQRAAEQRAAESRRLQEIHANARYGDIVRVSIQGGVLEYYNRQHTYHPLSFEIARGERKIVRAMQAGQVQQTIPFRVWLSEDGNTLIFNEGAHDQVVLVNRNWEQGQTYRPRPGERSSGFRLVGASYHVRLKELPGAPQRVIIEHR